MADPVRPDPAGPDRKPDAILFPTGWEPPVPWSADSRAVRLCAYFEPILGATVGQKAHWRDVPGGLWLVTLDRSDTLLYPEGHKLSKFPRYDWTTAEHGLQYGTLKKDDTPA